MHGQSACWLPGILAPVFCPSRVPVCSTKDLGDRLHIAESTVHTHRKRIRAKLGVPAGCSLYVYLKRHDF
ncbi:LuxR C-terminal-related transcriptional regulator [Desulfovibrio sp. OttesenSCG-928-C06]|nr:LuxR C-terminal-related transcriptional regulator [Desulfovibrio sp. OttesenSCG-928-C06]